MLRKVKRALKRAMIAMIRVREEQAAAELARYLVTQNKDFRNVSEYSLKKAILSKKEIKFDEIAAI